LEKVHYELTVPGVKDRVAQAAVKIVIEPLFEGSFRPGSYGFRPKRSARQAIYDIRKWVTYGYDKVIDLDLKSYFDTASYCPRVHESCSNSSGC
jgi:retron-type reverse transcriptase